MRLIGHFITIRILKQALDFANGAYRPNRINLIIRYAIFSFDNVWLLWLLYGNILYYEPKENLSNSFKGLFCAILAYGYIFIIKYMIDSVILCGFLPILLCDYSRILNPRNSQASQITEYELFVFLIVRQL